MWIKSLTENLLKIRNNQGTEWEREIESEKNTTDSKRIEEVKNIHKNCQRRGKQLEFTPIKLLAKKCASTKTVQLYLLSTLIDSWILSEERKNRRFRVSVVLQLVQWIWKQPIHLREHHVNLKATTQLAMQWEKVNKPGLSIWSPASMAKLKFNENKKIGPTVFPSISFVFCSFDCVCVIVKELFVCNENENSLRFLLFLKKIHTRSRCVFFPNFKFDCFSLSDCFSSLFHSLVYFSCSSNERNNFLTCIPFVTSLGSSK